MTPCERCDLYVKDMDADLGVGCVGAHIGGREAELRNFGRRAMFAPGILLHAGGYFEHGSRHR